MDIDDIGDNGNGSSTQCSTGLDQRICVLLAYLFGWLGGLIFFIVEKQNKVVRFHAMQSILLSAVYIVLMIALTILSFIPFLGIIFNLVNLLVSLGFLALIIVLIAFSFQGKQIKLPFIGDMALNWSETPV